DQQAAHPVVSRFANPLLALTVPAAVGSGGQSDQSGQLTAILNLSPAEDLPHQNPSPYHADPLEHQELGHLFRLGIGLIAYPTTLLDLQLSDLRVYQLPPLQLAEDPHLVLRRQRGTIPLPQLLQCLGQIGIDRGASQPE